MTVLNRMVRMIKADVHAVLDYLEAPEVLLQQAIREMDAELLLLNNVVVQKQQMLVALERKSKAWQESSSQQQGELNLCLQHGNDDLARSLLRKKLEVEKRLEQALQTIDQMKLELDQKQQLIDQRKHILVELKQQAEQVESFASDQPEQACYREFGITDADVELALLKAKGKRA